MASEATKREIKAAELRVAARKAELKDAERLGPAAVRCVQETLDADKARLAVLKGGAS